MKTYKSSDLTHKRAEVMREAEKNGVIIQECRTNGDIVKVYVLKAVDVESYKHSVSLGSWEPVNPIDDVKRGCS